MDGALQQFLTVLTLSFVLLLQALLYLLLQILLLFEGFLSEFSSSSGDFVVGDVVGHYSGDEPYSQSPLFSYISRVTFASIVNIFSGR